VIDPAVRDLLVAAHEALNAAEVRDYPVCAAQTAIRSAVRYGNLDTDWLVDLAERADVRRVGRADRLALWDGGV
jgi:hypothetical protein